MSVANKFDITQFARYGRKIFGAAFNFKDTPNAKIPDEPVVFLKPTTSYVFEGKPIVLPEKFTNVMHEVELGVIINKTCKNISTEDAAGCIGGYCLGLDMSAFCELIPARKNGHPWTIGKSFDTSNPVSRFISLDEIADCHNLDLWLRVNGELKQKGNTKDMIFNSYELISYISTFITLEPGDLIMTGTPTGSTKVSRGDVIEAGMGKNLVEIKFRVE